MAKVWAYFDAAGPLAAGSGRSPTGSRRTSGWRCCAASACGAFTSMVYPHKPGMARVAERLGGRLRVPYARLSADRDVLPGGRAPRRTCAPNWSRRGTGLQGACAGGRVRPGRCAARPGLGAFAEAGVPVVIHCGSGPGAGQVHRARADRRLLARHPRLRLIIAHMGMPEYTDFLDLAQRYPGVHSIRRWRSRTSPSGSRRSRGAERGRLTDLGDRVLFGSDFPNIPYGYAHALEALSGWSSGRSGCGGSVTGTGRGCSALSLGDPWLDEPSD